MKQDRNTTQDNFALVCTCSFTPTPPNNCRVLDVFQLCFSFRWMYNTPCVLHRSPEDERMSQNEFAVFLTWRKALLSALFHTHICLWDSTYFSLNKLLWLNVWGEGRKKLLSRNFHQEFSLQFKLSGGSEVGTKESSKEEVPKNVRSSADIPATLATAPASHDGTSLTAQLASVSQAKDPGR